MIGIRVRVSVRGFLHEDCSQFFCIVTFLSVCRNLFLFSVRIGSYIIMKESGSGLESGPAGLYQEILAVPEEPFGLPEKYWKAGLIIFSVFLMAVTILLLMRGNNAHVIGALYTIPAILFAYFYRRKGVLIVYLIAMFFFVAVVVFQYPSADYIFAAAIRSILLIAIALIVSYLTHYLLLEKRKYHAIFENTENGVILLNITDHRIAEMNERFARALGLSQLQVQNRDLKDFLRDPSPLNDLVSVLHTRCSIPALEFTMQKADGAEWAAVIAARKISADHAVLTFIDITERREIDRQLRQCNLDAGLYLDILTHDINNINTASLNYGRLLETRSGDSREDTARKLLHSLEKSDEIIRNVSTLRKIRDVSSRKVPIRLSGMIRNEISVFPETAIDYNGSDAVVLADDMLSSVFNNLIGNAIKYGGKVPRITIRVEDQGTDVIVSVGDTGQGIPESFRQHLFERFQRGDTTVSGKGLGLFICKTLVERYGGRIWAEDRVPGNPTQGAVFRFTLPKA